MKRLATLLLTASVALGSALATSGPTMAAPMPQPIAADTSGILLVRSDDRPPYRWDYRQRDDRRWRHDRRDDRRYWHRERWRERQWRRDHYRRYNRGPAIILDF